RGSCAVRSASERRSRISTCETSGRMSWPPSIRTAVWCPTSTRPTTTPRRARICARGRRPREERTAAPGHSQSRALAARARSPMILPIQDRLRAHLTRLLASLYSLEGAAAPPPVLEYPPTRELGDLG